MGSPGDPANAVQARRRLDSAVARTSGWRAGRYAVLLGTWLSHPHKATDRPCAIAPASEVFLSWRSSLVMAWTGTRRQRNHAENDGTPAPALAMRAALGIAAERRFRPLEDVSSGAGSSLPAAETPGVGSERLGAQHPCSTHFKYIPHFPSRQPARAVLSRGSRRNIV